MGAEERTRLKRRVVRCGGETPAPTPRGVADPSGGGGGGRSLGCEGRKACRRAALALARTGEAGGGRDDAREGSWAWSRSWSRGGARRAALTAAVVPAGARGGRRNPESPHFSSISHRNYRLLLILYGTRGLLAPRFASDVDRGLQNLFSSNIRNQLQTGSQSTESFSTQLSRAA